MGFMVMACIDKSTWHSASQQALKGCTGEGSKVDFRAWLASIKALGIAGLNTN